MKYEVHWIKTYHAAGTFIVDANSEAEAKARGLELGCMQYDDGEVDFVKEVKPEKEGD